MLLIQTRKLNLASRSNSSKPDNEEEVLTKFHASHFGFSSSKDCTSDKFAICQLYQDMYETKILKDGNTSNINSKECNRIVIM